MKNLKIGDRVLVKTYGLSSTTFHAEILIIDRKWWWFDSYVCKWRVHDMDYNQHYEKIDVLRSWNILGKN